MSDHAPFRELQDRSIRMVPEDLPLYIKECDDCIQKYRNRIKVYKALEIEFFPGHEEKYQELLGKLDYLALGQHYIADPTAPNQLRSTYKLTSFEHLVTYVDMVVEAIKTGFFKFVCHPDVFLYNVQHMSDDILNECTRLIRAAKAYHVPLEINANGIRKGIRQLEDGLRYLYPRLEFWEIAKAEKVKVIVSSDAHQPSTLFDDDVKMAYKFAYDIGIEVEEAIEI